jgi:hypothetical protein
MIDPLQGLIGSLQTQKIRYWSLNQAATLNPACGNSRVSTQDNIVTNANKIKGRTSERGPDMAECASSSS